VDSYRSHGEMTISLFIYLFIHLLLSLIPLHVRSVAQRDLSFHIRCSHSVCKVISLVPKQSRKWTWNSL